MISSELRMALVQNFPRGTPLVVVAPQVKGFEQVAAEYDTAVVVLALAEDGKVPAHPALTTTANVILEGLEDVDDPVQLLRATREAAPVARLFCLVPNAAYLRDLGAFFEGAPLALGHPLVESELDPLLRAGGWQPLAITPVPDESIPAGPVPIDLNMPSISFRISRTDALVRGRVQAFVIVADRA